MLEKNKRTSVELGEEPLKQSIPHVVLIKSLDPMEMKAKSLRAINEHQSPE